MFGSRKRMKRRRHPEGEEGPAGKKGESRTKMQLPVQQGAPVLIVEALV